MLKLIQAASLLALYFTGKGLSVSANDEITEEEQKTYSFDDLLPYLKLYEEDSFNEIVTSGSTVTTFTMPSYAANKQVKLQLSGYTTFTNSTRCTGSISNTTTTYTYCNNAAHAGKTYYIDASAWYSYFASKTATPSSVRCAGSQDANSGTTLYTAVTCASNTSQCTPTSAASNLGTLTTVTTTCT